MIKTVNMNKSAAPASKWLYSFGTGAALSVPMILGAKNLSNETYERAAKAKEATDAVKDISNNLAARSEELDKKEETLNKFIKAKQYVKDVKDSIFNTVKENPLAATVATLGLGSLGATLYLRNKRNKKELEKSSNMHKLAGPVDALAKGILGFGAGTALSIPIMHDALNTNRQANKDIIDARNSMNNLYDKAVELDNRANELAKKEEEAKLFPEIQKNISAKIKSGLNAIKENPTTAALTALGLGGIGTALYLNHKDKKKKKELEKVSSMGKLLGKGLLGLGLGATASTPLFMNAYKKNIAADNALTEANLLASDVNAQQKDVDAAWQNLRDEYAQMHRDKLKVTNDRVALDLQKRDVAKQEAKAKAIIDNYKNLSIKQHLAGIKDSIVNTIKENPTTTALTALGLGGIGTALYLNHKDKKKKKELEKESSMNKYVNKNIEYALGYNQYLPNKGRFGNIVKKADADKYYNAATNDDVYPLTEELIKKRKAIDKIVSEQENHILNMDSAVEKYENPGISEYASNIWDKTKRHVYDNAPGYALGLGGLGVAYLLYRNRKKLRELENKKKKKELEKSARKYDAYPIYPIPDYFDLDLSTLAEDKDKVLDALKERVDNYNLTRYYANAYEDALKSTLDNYKRNRDNYTRIYNLNSRLAELKNEAYKRPIWDDIKGLAGSTKDYIIENKAPLLALSALGLGGLGAAYMWHKDRKKIKALRKEEEEENKKTEKKASTGDSTSEAIDSAANGIKGLYEAAKQKGSEVAKYIGEGKEALDNKMRNVAENLSDKGGEVYDSLKAGGNRLTKALEKIYGGTRDAVLSGVDLMREHPNATTAAVLGLGGLGAYKLLRGKKKKPAIYG